MVSFNVLCIVCCMIVMASAFPEEAPIVAGVKELSGGDLKEAETILKTSLTKLAAGGGPHYTLSKIHSASVQTVSGSLYKYKADLEDKEKNIKKCNVTIWSQPWLENGIEVTFECEGAEKLIKKHSA